MKGQDQKRNSLRRTKGFITSFTSLTFSPLHLLPIQPPDSDPTA